MTTIDAGFETQTEELADTALEDFEFENTGDGASAHASPAFDESALAELVHDIRNTIGAVAMLSELTSLELAENSDLREMTRNVQQACQDAGAQCEQMLATLRGSPARTESTDLSALIQGMTPLLATWIPPAAVLRFNLAHDLPRLELTPTDIRQVVMNLVKNAAEAVSDRPGIVTVSTGWIELTAGSLSVLDGCSAERQVRHVCLTVSDTGCGIDEPTRARLQAGAYTTKPNGHGLGLASVRRIVAAHGARLLLSSRAGAGTTVRVVLGVGSPVNVPVSVPIDAMHGLFQATEDIRVLPLVQGVATLHRMDFPLPGRTTRGTRLRLCGVESMAGAPTP